MTDDFERCLGGGIMILDGAMGTLLSNNGTCCDNLCLSDPDAVYRAHLAYIEAGADIITTDTFNANTQALARYGFSKHADDICSAGVRLARMAVADSGRQCFVAGCLGACTASPATTEAYRRQANALITAGADTLLLETIFDLDGAIAAIKGILTAFENTGLRLPLMLSATLTREGCLPSGHTLEQFIEATRHSGAISYGINCGFGIESSAPWIKRLGELTHAYISFHPNAGLPDATGRYACTPERLTEAMRPLLRDCRLNIIGGCCGTTPGHIRVLANEIRHLTINA